MLSCFEFFVVHGQNETIDFVPNADKTGGLVTAEEWQWEQDSNPQAKGYHPVLPRDPAGGIPWQHVRPCIRLATFWFPYIDRRSCEEADRNAGCLLAGLAAAWQYIYMLIRFKPSQTWNCTASVHTIGIGVQIKKAFLHVQAMYRRGVHGLPEYS